MTAIFAVGGLLNPVLFVFAPVFASVTYLLYSHATGRLLGRFYRGVEQRAAQGGTDRGRGGFGAGPREEWTSPGENRRQTRRRRERTGRRRRQGRHRQAGVGAGDEPTSREAYSVLGVDPGADEEAVREAYRSRVKEVHPDTEGGDQDEFKRVREAYEVLTD
jgi:DnaJ-domain-containing protein 1